MTPTEAQKVNKGVQIMGGVSANLQSNSQELIRAGQSMQDRRAGQALINMGKVLEKAESAIKSEFSVIKAEL